MAKRKRRKKRQRAKPELPLFDLPLHPELEDSAAEDGTAVELAEAVDKAETLEETTAETEPAAGDEPEQSRLFDDGESTTRDAPETEEAPSTEPEIPAPLGERLQAGLADLAVHVLMLAVAVTASFRLGVQVTWDFWPPFAVLSLAFSFLYWVIPLAFWGQTPGMAWVGHHARSRDDNPLTFNQAALRWLGAVLTLGLAGLPLLLALSGASLTDRLSGSESIVVEA